MPEKLLNWEDVRDVLVKRRKAGQAPHWSMGWAAARIARNESDVVNAAYKHVVLDYFAAHAAGNEDAVKTRTWHRLIGFVDGLHNATLPGLDSESDSDAESPAVSADDVTAQF